MPSPGPKALTTIGFDADDTLWHHEQYFRMTTDRFAALLADYAAPDHLQQRLLAAEHRNLRHYGFGVKGFVLSMIETALEVTASRVPAAVIKELLDAGREMLAHPIDLLPHVETAVSALAADYRLVLITKGDLIDQERKLAQSGLGDRFDAIEIVSDKSEQTYRAVFSRHGTGADQAMMVGNSLKSDVIPALSAGSWAVHVPSALIWALDHAEPPASSPRFHSIADLGALPSLVAAVQAGVIPRSGG